MPKSLLEEGQLLLFFGSWQNLEICHFCIFKSVHLMGMSPTCVLKYVMPSFQWCSPCIFVISVVTSISMQSRPRNISDFWDLVISLSPCLLLFCCHVNLMLQRDACIFWRCSVRMFCSYSCNGPIPALVCNYGVPQHDTILLYFCYKIFLADS